MWIKYSKQRKQLKYRKQDGNLTDQRKIDKFRGHLGKKSTDLNDLLYVRNEGKNKLKILPKFGA